MAHGKPLIAVNHLEGHALSPRLAEGGATFPYLSVAGLRRALPVHRGDGCRRLSPSWFDRRRRRSAKPSTKLAKLLDLGFPGGPFVEQSSRNGDSKRFSLPRPMLGRDDCDFSFAGLKTACAREAARLGELTDRDKADLCASFQASGHRHRRRPHAQRHARVRSRLWREGQTGGRRRRRRQSGDPNLSGEAWRRSAATISSPRRSNGAPTMRR